MAIDPSRTSIFHITDVSNLPDILQSGHIFSDAQLQRFHEAPTVIGMPHIKQRRLTELTIACCGDRYVGEFVPFYYCPRSPMLYTINLGNTGRDAGCQKSIVHLVSTVTQGMSLGRAWAISDGNAGARHTSFANQASALDRLDWSTINNRLWQGKTHTKHSEFLVADYFPWTSISTIGCYNAATAAQVANIIASNRHQPAVQIQPTWYY